MKYFRVHPDTAMQERWILGDVRYVSNWDFLDPSVECMEPCQYTLDLHLDGVAADFAVAGYASIPIVSAKFRNALSGLPEVDEQYMNTVMEPVLIVGSNDVDERFVLIVESRFDCIDDANSSFTRFAIGDPELPLLSEENCTSFKLALDPGRVGDMHIFRLVGYPHALIVSEEVRARLEGEGVTGIAFEEMLVLS